MSIFYRLANDQVNKQFETNSGISGNIYIKAVVVSGCCRLDIQTICTALESSVVFISGIFRLLNEHILRLNQSFADDFHFQQLLCNKLFTGIDDILVCSKCFCFIPSLQNIFVK